VPVSHRPRRAGKSHYGLVDRGFSGFADLLAVRWMARRRRRPEVLPLLRDRP
jgi:dolichol-phosphate mannosyltransferase